MTREFGDGTRWRIISTVFNDWYIYRPLQPNKWVDPRRDQLATVPEGKYPTFEEARAAFAAGNTTRNKGETQ